MKHISIASFFLMLVVPGVCAQSGTKEINSPKQVVEEFWKLETEGGRLTAKGWYKAGVFFVRPGPAPRKKTIAITSGKHKCSVDERWVRGNHAEIANQCFDLGRIDNSLRYTPPDSLAYKINLVYRLTLTDKHWEIGPDGVTETEVSGPLAWRIENPEPVLWLTVGAAARYVREQRDKTSDPAIKKNADQTLAALLKPH